MKFNENREKKLSYSPEILIVTEALPVFPTSSVTVHVWFPLSAACTTVAEIEFCEDC